MGMYTQLCFTAQLTDDGVRVVQALKRAQEDKAEAYKTGRHTEPAWMSVMPDVVDIARKVGTDPTAPLAFLNHDRMDFIPFGWAGGLEGREWQNDLKDNVWTVCCELKNYTQTVQCFLNVILPLLIAEPVKATSQFEEAEKAEVILVQPAEAASDV